MLQHLDETLFYFINKGMRNPFFDTIMPFITHYKYWYLPGAIFLCILLKKDYKKALSVILITVIAVIIADGINHNILKPFFGRMRPCNDLTDIHLLSGCTSSYSFPSNHASNVFALCTVLAYEYRKTLFIMIGIASAVAYSRVYLGVHYPADVVFGGIFGIGYAGLLLYFIKKISEKYTIKLLKIRGTPNEK